MDTLPGKKGAITCTVDEAIRLTGVGCFHWLLVVATGMCSASAVFEIVSPSYLLSPAAWAPCDLGMEPSDKGLLSAIVFVGMIVGTYLWGVLADSWGRRPLLRLTLLCDAVVGVVSSFLPDKRLFIAARFFNGFLVAGPTSTAMTFLGEFHSEATRSKAMLILGLFPGAATLVVAALAYLVLPLPITWDQLPWLETYRSWRLYVLLNAMPSLLTGLAFLWFPESPRYLVSTGRSAKALDTLRRVHAMNQGRDKEFPVGALVSPTDAPAKSDGNKLLAIWNQTVPLFGRQYIRITLLICTLMFAAVSSANGLLVWMPYIFNRMATFSDIRPGETVTACEAIDGLQHMAYSVNVSSVLQECGGVLPDDMFLNTGAIGIANVVVGLLGAVAVNCLGKRNLLVGIYVVAGLSAVLMTVLGSSPVLLGLACVHVGLTSTAISVTMSVVVENYPTILRATAASLAMLAGRGGSMSGSLVFGALLDSECSAVFWGLGALLAVCGGLGMLLPRRGLFAT